MENDLLEPAHHFPIAPRDFLIPTPGYLPHLTGFFAAPRDFLTVGRQIFLRRNHL